VALLERRETEWVRHFSHWGIQPEVDPATAAVAYDWWPIANSDEGDRNGGAVRLECAITLCTRDGKYQWVKYGFDLLLQHDDSADDFDGLGSTKGLVRKGIWRFTPQQCELFERNLSDLLKKMIELLLQEGYEAVYVQGPLFPKLRQRLGYAWLPKERTIAFFTFQKGWFVTRMHPPGEADPTNWNFDRFTELSAFGPYPSLMEDGVSREWQIYEKSEDTWEWRLNVEIFCQMAGENGEIWRNHLKKVKTSIQHDRNGKVLVDGKHFEFLPFLLAVAVEASHQYQVDFSYLQEKLTIVGKKGELKPLGWFENDNGAIVGSIEEFDDPFLRVLTRLFLSHLSQKESESMERWISSWISSSLSHTKQKQIKQRAEELRRAPGLKSPSALFVALRLDSNPRRFWADFIDRVKNPEGQP